MFWTENSKQVVMKPLGFWEGRTEHAKTWRDFKETELRSHLWSNQLSKRVSQLWWLKILWRCKYQLLVCRAQVRSPLEHRKTKCNFEWFYTGHIQQPSMDLRWYISVSKTSDEASGITILSDTSRTVSKPFQKINNPTFTFSACRYMHFTSNSSNLVLTTVKKDRNNQLGSFIYSFFQLPLQLDWAHWTPLILREKLQNRKLPQNKMM